MATLAIFKLIFGPLLGMAGAWMTQRSENQAEERKAKERAEERAHDLLLINAEADLAMKKANIDADSRKEVAETTAFADSYNFAAENLIPDGAKLTTKQLNRVVNVEVLNKSIRPWGVIWYQILLAVVFGWAAYRLVNSSAEVFSDVQIATLFRDIAYSIIGMAETSYFWYFGIRRMSKKQP